MMEVALLFLLVFLGAQAGNENGVNDRHFVGGAISFEFINTSLPIYKIKVTAITGWVLGMGPCGPNCSLSDIGRSTKNTRKDLLHVNGDSYFGNWNKEISFNHSYFSQYESITSYLVDKLDGHVFAVNRPMKWEQEIAEFTLDIDQNIEYADISFHGEYWRELNYPKEVSETQVQFHLQIKVKPKERDDTGKPNNSPVAIFKPVYKILLNSKTTIKLSTMDRDDDVVKCQYAEFVEAGGLGRMQNTIVNSDCSVVIDAQESAGFYDKGWGAIPVKVSDYSKTPKQGSQDIVGDSSMILSAILVQFMIQTLETIEAPEFVDPTLESQHEFNVFIGSTLTIPLYAKPMDGSLHEVDYFYIRSIPTRPFVVDRPTPDPNRNTSEQVKYSIVNWRPGKSDVGQYVLSAIVTDEKGSDGIDRNYNVVVKDLNFIAPEALSPSGPYFQLFPNITGIVCMHHSTCSFPIYSNTRTPSGNIISVISTTSTFKTITIKDPIKINKEGTSMYVTDVTVQAEARGEQRICFEAKDNTGEMSEIKCLGVTVELPDPCKSNPCLNGDCISNDDSFACHCGWKYTGTLCDKEIDFCTSSPCLNSGKCLTDEHVGYKCDCTGTDHLGLNCEKEIVYCKPGVCGVHGVCKNIDHDTKCDCFPGYGGQRCDQVDTKCSNVTCDNNGICIVESGAGVCNCPLGFKGPTCLDTDGITPVNNVNKESHFTVPSLTNGAEFRCFVGVPCAIPLFTNKPSSGSSPDLRVGFHSPEISATFGRPTPDSLSETVHTDLSVTASVPGVQTVCVESGDTNPDILCYKVRASEIPGVVNDKYMMPRFLSPTPQDGSTINCIQNKRCHMIISASLDLQTKKCAIFSGSSSAIIFDPIRTDSRMCQIDVLIKPPPGGDPNVCFHAGPMWEFHTHKVQGEKRCFKVKTAVQDNCNPNPCQKGGSCLHQPGEIPPYTCICTSNATGTICQFRNPCMSNPCKNDAFCEAHDSKYVCKCRLGNTGTTCNEVTQHTFEPEFTDPTLKNGATVECEVEATCVIPIYTRGPSTELVQGPTDGDVDVSLTKPVANSWNNLNEGRLEVTPKTAGEKKVCIQTAAATHSNQEVCYHIQTKLPGSTEVIAKDHFESPTLPERTTIPCDTDAMCHVIMHSKPLSNKCRQVSTTNQSEVSYHIFPTKLQAGSCYTEVLFTPNETSGLQQVCLNLRNNPNPRCFNIDPRISDPCKNQNCGNGTCIVESPYNHSCVCDNTHTGALCNIYAPCKSSPCLNSGICEEEGRRFQCHCTVGYTGETCETSTDASFIQPSFSRATPASGSTFNCQKGHVCQIPLSVASQQRPVLKIGPHSDGVHISVPRQPSKDTDIPGRSDLYIGHIDVTPSEIGDKKVCVKTGVKNSTFDGEDEDTVCFNLRVTDSENRTQDNFKEPTPASGSQIRCPPSSDCHFLVHSELQNGNCPQVIISSGNVNIFPTTRDVTFLNCITDVSVSSKYLSSQSAVCIRARPGDPERCFSINPCPITDPCSTNFCNSSTGACILEQDNSPTCVCYNSSTEANCRTCRPDTCLNNGVCRETTSGHICDCPVYYSGSNCEIEIHTSLNKEPYMYFTSPTFESGTSFNCIQDQVCSIPVTVASSIKTSQLLEVQSPDLKASISVELTNDTSTKKAPLLYSCLIQVTASTTGKKQLCLKTKLVFNRNACQNQEMICYHINFVNEGGNNSDAFRDPTPGNGSRLTCSQGKDCHVIVYSQKHLGKCDQVTRTTGSAVIYQTRLDATATDCVTDVMFRISNESFSLVCLKARPGLQEERCFTIAVPQIATIAGPTAPSSGYVERSDLDCSAGQMHVHIPLSLLPIHTVTLRDPTCKVTSNGTHLVADVGLNECGTTVSFTNNSVIFTNDIVATVRLAAGVTTSNIIDYGLNKDNQRVAISCVFPRENRIDFGYVPLQRKAHFYEKQYGNLIFEINQYQDEQFTRMLPHTGLPIGVTLNTEIFIDIAVDHNSNKGVGITVESCIATPTQSPADPVWYPLIKNGCPVQSDIRTFSSPDENEFRFSFLAFKFTRSPLQKIDPSLPASPMVYLHCQVFACPRQNCTSSCQGHSRSRREAESENAHLVSAGPFYLKSEEESQGYSGGIVAGTLSVACLTTLIALVAVVAWRRSVNKLSRYQNAQMTS